MYKSFFKRILDVIFGFLGLLAFAFSCVFVVPWIYFSDKGSVLYRAERLGKDGKPFKMYKFRSMYVDAPDIRNADGSTYNGEDDPRVTRVGKFLRRTSLDEIPQFINVFIGDMSLIGPRPDPLDDMEIYTPYQKRKLAVRPGITGYNQAFFRNSVEQNVKFDHDVYYVEHLSFALDVKIFINTVIAVLLQKNIFNDVSKPDAAE